MLEHIIRDDPRLGERIFGRFKVHPDKLLLRIWPIKAIDEKSGLFIPASAKKREMTFRWARIIQVGERLASFYPDYFNIGDVVIVNKFVDQVYGVEGKFKLGGKFVCVTVASEVLMAVEGDDIPDYIKESGNVKIK
jgi:hypothetical protein